MKRIYTALIAMSCAAAGLEQTMAITVDERGTGASEIVQIDVTGFGQLFVEAGIIKLDVGGIQLDGFCIDPFHFSDGLMPGYQIVGLTAAPKGRFMSAGTATEIERLWGSHYAAGMSSADAAGLQIAIWELTGGSDFKLRSNNDFGAAGFLSAVQVPNYDGTTADLSGLTGPGQDYCVQAGSVDVLTQAVPDIGSTLGLLGFSVLTLVIASWRGPRLAVVRA